MAKIRANDDDVWSRGYLCPKGTTLGELHHDPDRLRAPLVRDGEGWREVTLGRGVRARSRAACVRCSSGTARRPSRAYIGNPTAHNFSLSRYVPAFIAMAGLPVLYSAGTVDQWPKNLDERADVRRHVGVPGARPRPHRLPADARREPARLAGEPARRAPTCSGRLDAIRARGGRVVVVDPRRTGTADHATSGCRSGPAPTRRSCSRIAHVLFAEGRVRLGALAGRVNGVDEVRARRRGRSRPRRSRETCGIPAETIRRLARELAGRAARRGLRPHRHLQPGVRHARVVAGRRAERADRQPRPRGRRDVREPDRVVAGVAAAARVRERLHAAPLALARARRARGARPGAGLVPRGGDRDARARGRSARSITIAGNPVISRARRREARRRAARARVHGQRRQLAERDDAPRRT